MDRNDIFMAVQTLVAGERLRDALPALLDAAAIAVCIAAEDLEEADAMIDSLPADMKACVRLNWDRMQADRAAPTTVASA